jgi:hypothetical protein
MHSLLRTWAVLMAALALAVGVPALAHADETGESDQAKVLVLQAIAMLVNEPDDVMAVEERIGDALEAPDTEGVDLAMVEQAAAALEDSDLRRTRDLLQSSIGAGPYLGTGVPPSIRQTSGEPGAPAYAVGTETGTAVVLDPYRPDRGLNGGETALLIISIAAIAGGVVLAWRVRPADTVRQLRRTAPGEEA